MLPSNNIETFTNEQRQRFARRHPALLGQKHQQTVKSIKDLQEVEKYMFKNLQALNKSSPNSIQETEVIKKRLSELSQMRLTLFGQLKNMYSEGQREVADSRNNLTDQKTSTNCKPLVVILRQMCYRSVGLCTVQRRQNLCLFVGIVVRM